METLNKQIVHEIIILIYASKREWNESLKSNNNSQYHISKSDSYDFLYNKIYEIIGKRIGDRFSTISVDEKGYEEILKMPLTPEQKRAFHELRKNPSYKEAMGIFALQHKKELEEILGNEIGYYLDDPFTGKDIPKTEKRLLGELKIFNKKLEELYESNSINEQEYHKYGEYLTYIYEYYFSLSRNNNAKLNISPDIKKETQFERQNAMGFIENETGTIKFDLPPQRERPKRQENIEINMRRPDALRLIHKQLEQLGIEQEKDDVEPVEERRPRRL